MKGWSGGACGCALCSCALSVRHLLGHRTSPSHTPSTPPTHTRTQMEGMVNDLQLAKEKEKHFDGGCVCVCVGGGWALGWLVV